MLYAKRWSLRPDRFRSFLPLARPRWSRALAYVIATVALAGGHGASLLAEPAESAIENLGSPITSVTVADAAYGHGPDGEPWIYLLVRGAPAVLQVIDARTGERAHHVPLEGAMISWGLDVAPDGRVYIGSQKLGFLYRWDPVSAVLENLGVAIDGETHHWDLDVGPEGNVYGGTYPGGKVFQYAPDTGRLRDYGQLVDGENYVRSVAAGDTTVYAGTGAQRGQLVAIDPDTGETRPIALPSEHAERTQQVYRLRFVDGLLFVEVHPGPHFLIYDTRSESWRGEIGGLPSPTGPDGHLYFVDGDGLQRFKPATLEVTATGFKPDPDTRQFAWFDLDDPTWPGLSLVSTNMRGAYWVYNPATGKGEYRTADTTGQPTDLRSTMVAPDNQLYIGGYLSPGMIARRDPGTGEFTALPGVSQVEGWGIHNGLIYMGVYPDAKIVVYDPSKPWSPTVNPKRLFQVGHDQDRPFAITAAGEWVAIGTVPAVGVLGGALTLYHPQTDEVRVRHNIVHEQSVVSLVYRDGVLIGGTSASGGLGIAESQKEGQLFYWDIAADRIIWQGSPVPGTRSITGLTLDAAGDLWGVADGHLFRFDPEERRTIRSMELFPGRRPSPYIWVNGYLNFHEDGQLYGKVWDRIFRMDLQTWRITELTRGHYFSQDQSGDIFFGRQTHLFRLPYESARPAE